MAISITYFDAMGCTSVRNIIIARAWIRDDGDIVIQAYCDKTQRQRTFLASRIKSITDLLTGETFKKARPYLLKRLRLDDNHNRLVCLHTAIAIDRCRPELILFICIVGGFNHFSGVEKDAVLNYVERRCSDLEIDQTKILSFLAGLRPNEAGLREALNTILIGEANSLHEIVQVISHIGCDGHHVSTRKRSVLSQLYEQIANKALDITPLDIYPNNSASVIDDQGRRHKHLFPLQRKDDPADGASLQLKAIEALGIEITEENISEKAIILMMDALQYIWSVYAVTVCCKDYPPRRAQNATLKFILNDHDLAAYVSSWGANRFNRRHHSRKMWLPPNEHFFRVAAHLRQHC